ncbi:MAG TPA: hypothetical protein VG204_23170 [Terriglobia bacterium]|nr:hypothetical protein [Terriglobia bacterium]
MLQSCTLDLRAAPSRQEALPHVINRLLTALYILFCFEVGVCLVIVPWITLWGQNYFVARFPWIALLTRNYFIRGAISGIGVADIWLGFYEIWFRLRRQREAKARG